MEAAIQLEQEEEPESEKAQLKSITREADLKRFNEAVRLHEWGSWVKGIAILEELRLSGLQEAIDYMDPVASKIKNPTGMFWMSAHFEDLGGEESKIISAAWYGKAITRGGIVPAALVETLGHSTMPEVRTKRRWDKFYKEALSSISWGYWLQGFEQLEKLAKEGHADSKAYLDPDLSPLKNPTGMEHLANMLEERMKDLMLIYNDPGPTKDQSIQIAQLEAMIASWRMKAAQIKGVSARAGRRPTNTASSTTHIVQLSGNHEADFKAAKNNIDWGHYAKGIEAIGHLAKSGHQPSMDYLDTTKSNVKNPATMHFIGLHHLNETKDDIAACTWFRKAAEAGNHRSMTELGKLVADGRGGPAKGGKPDVPDPWQAIGWYTKAWDVGGNGDAAFELGKAYADGVAVQEEVKSKKKENEKSGVNTVDSVESTLISLDESSADEKKKEERSKERESKLVTTEATAKDAHQQSSETEEAPAEPAKVYRTKIIVKQDDTKAVEWFKRGVAKDHPGCHNMLGECLREGRGIPENTRQATEHFRRAAQAGLAIAMYNYGSCLLHGVGCEVDETKALLWLTKASKASEGEGAPEMNGPTA
jgi:TPR repeat protein